jgi:acetyl-CoA carboxylase, biotin carboxylase subunit
MLSKLIAFAPTRALAIDRMLRALDEYVIGGIRTNLGLFRRILRDAEFRAARIDTGYLDRLLGQAQTGAEGPVPEAAVAAAAVFEATRPAAKNGSSAAPPASAWKTAARNEGVSTGR